MQPSYRIIEKEKYVRTVLIYQTFKHGLFNRKWGIPMLQRSKCELSFQLRPTYTLKTVIYCIWLSAGNILIYKKCWTLGNSDSVTITKDYVTEQNT